MKIAIIGKGHVGTALGSGLTRAGHEIRYGHRDPGEPVHDAAEWGDVIVLAIPYPAIPDAALTIGSAADGKLLIDVTNALDRNGNLAIGCTTSAAEELQKMLPRAHVIKAFNTVFAPNQTSGKLGGEDLTAFIAGDDERSKETAMRLARDIGFDPVDAGPLKSARYLEPMALLLIELGYGLKMGTGIGYKLVRG
ncbi:MAG TPA: NADPH-dependent F420 reductase [Methanomicrobiales archaeon]|nr:NADPH-dependent F420 reductase [Methanomicrobiales archaeon]